MRGTLFFNNIIKHHECHSDKNNSLGNQKIDRREDICNICADEEPTAGFDRRQQNRDHDREEQNGEQDIARPRLHGHGCKQCTYSNVTDGAEQYHQQ